jgi:hypothetical protein
MQTKEEMTAEQIHAEWDKIYGAFKADAMKLTERVGAERLSLRTPDGRSISMEMVLEVK